MVWGIFDWEEMKLSQSKYGSFVLSAGYQDKITLRGRVNLEGLQTYLELHNRG